MTMIGLRRDTLEQIVVLVQGFARLSALVAAVAAGFRTVWPAAAGSRRDAARGLFRLHYRRIDDLAVVAARRRHHVHVRRDCDARRAELAQRALSCRAPGSTPGVSNSIRTIIGYVGVVVALLFGGARLGLDLQKFAIVAGALSVGIGFGLQGIVNNFVSGLILLWERGIRVGDWVVVGERTGFRAPDQRARDRDRDLRPRDPDRAQFDVGDGHRQELDVQRSHRAHHRHRSTSTTTPTRRRCGRC